MNLGHSIISQQNNDKNCRTSFLSGVYNVIGHSSLALPFISIGTNGTKAVRKTIDWNVFISPRASQQQQHLKHQAPVNVLSSHIISALVVIKMMKKFISMETSMTFWPPAALLHDYLGGLLVKYGSIIYLGKGYWARVF